MNLSHTLFLLKFIHPFGVSSNTRKETESVFVKLEYLGFTGYGEACLPAYLGESVIETQKFLDKSKLLLRNSSTQDKIADILMNIDNLSEGNNAAKAAIDIALHDLFAKISGMSFREMMGLERTQAMPTSITIGIDTEAILERKIEAAADFSVLKIKAGTANDKQLIKLIRKYTDKPLYVDVNQGWTNKEQVLELIYWMKEQGVILIEQPMPVRMKEEMQWVTARSPIITIADESVKRLKDLESLNGSFSGVNIKLMKCTGLVEAMKMIDFCKKSKLKILLGCMAESSCATTAMAQLMQFGDYIDLDAPKLYTNDPFQGIEYKEGKVYVNDMPGIGVEPKIELFV